MCLADSTPGSHQHVAVQSDVLSGVFFPVGFDPRQSAITYLILITSGVCDDWLPNVLQLLIEESGKLLLLRQR